MKLFIAYFALAVLATSTLAQNFPIVYDFTTNKDTQNQFTSSLQNGATLETFGSYGVLNLGSDNGYIDLGNQFGNMILSLGSNFTISVTLFVPTTTDISGNGNFIWCFSRSSNSGYMFINAKEMRYAITQSSWNDETSVNPAAALPEGKWVNIIYEQDGNIGSVYLDNELKAQNTSVNLLPSSLSQLQNNYLGRSCYNGDAYLKNARYADFRIYNTSLTESQREIFVETVNELNRMEKGIYTDEDAVDYDISVLNIPKVAYKSIDLPNNGTFGSQITWTSSNNAYISNTGKVVKQESDRDIECTLTATFTLGNITKTKTYSVKVKQKEPYRHYLFAFFPSNNDENIYFAVGDDGYNYTTINNDQAVFLAQGNTVMGGLRDPHILRGQDGNFYMVATDMKSSLGWTSNRGIVLMKSSDLINWTSSTVHFPTKYAGTYLENVTRVWAPETIYDKNAGKYMIYFSILTNDGTVGHDKVFYCYANSDFTNLEGEPVFFYDRGTSTIDMDIVYNEADELYHAVYKNEGSGGICKVTANSLTPESGESNGSQWKNPSARLEQTNVAVEGAGLFRLINDDNWILMYDCYGSGYYQFCSSPDLKNFTWEKNTTTSGSFTPRHGTVLPITQNEYENLLNAFPCDLLTEEILPDSQGNYNITYERISGLAESTSNWTSISGFGLLARNDLYVNGEAKINGNFIERWRSGMSIGENNATKQLKYLPKGSYKLSLSCIATWQNDASVVVSGVNCWADDQSADMHTENGVPQLYNLTFDISQDDEYTTSFGISTYENTNANWVAFDNIRLYFVGTEEQYRNAMRNMHYDYIERAEALYDDLCDEFIDELRDVVNSVNPDETDFTAITNQLDNLTAAIAVAKEHISQTTILRESDTVLPTAKTVAHVKFVCESGFNEGGIWNTICLPFNMTAMQVDNVFGDGTVIKKLDNVTEQENNMTLSFDNIDHIEANTPYLIKPTNIKTSYCINDVEVLPSDNPQTTIDGLLAFMGNYQNNKVLTAKDYYILNNKILNANGSQKIKAYRAYFEVFSNEVKQLSLSEEITGIQPLNLFYVTNSNHLYDLQGRSIKNNGSLPNGIYIQDGVKLVIKP